LARDIEIVAFDDRGAGNGWLLPAGPLREPLHTPSLAKHHIVLYTGGVASTPLPGFVAQRRLGGLLSLSDWWAARPPGDLRQLAGPTTTTSAACPGRPMQPTWSSPKKTPSSWTRPAWHSKHLPRVCG
jgi:hypothetical protein